MSDSKIIDNIGGTDAVAAIVGLDKSSVSKWRKRGIPRSWRLYLEKRRPKAFQPDSKK